MGKALKILMAVYFSFHSICFRFNLRIVFSLAQKVATTSLLKVTIFPRYCLMQTAGVMAKGNRQSLYTVCPGQTRRRTSNMNSKLIFLEAVYNQACN